MKFLLPLLILASPALAGEVTNVVVRFVVTNEKLGLKVSEYQTDSIKGLLVQEVTPGKPGELTGLQREDVLLGWCTTDVVAGNGDRFPPADMRSFLQFPPSIGSMNTVQRLLVYRPSRDQVAVLTVHFGGKVAPWPGGSLGIFVKEQEHAPLKLRTRNVDVPLDVVVATVHPYSIAEKIGIKVGDLLYSGSIRQTDGELLKFDFNGVKSMERFINAYKEPGTEEVIFKVKRQVPDGAPADSGDLTFVIPMSKLK